VAGMQQRGFNADTAPRSRGRQGDTLEYRLQKKDRDRLVKHLKHLINSVDRCSNKAVLVDSDMKEIVTVYNLM